MERNMTLLIDAETRDIVFDENGELAMIFGGETTAQCARLTLQAYKKESPFDLTHGTDYARIMGAKPNEISDDEIQEIIREAVYQENDISQANNIEVTHNDNRGLNIVFDGALANGNIINMEVGAIE